MKYSNLFLLSVISILFFPSILFACTGFAAVEDGKVWAGNNEDFYSDPPTAIWFVPAEGDKHGYVAYGYNDTYFSQGGMNDQGLFFDGMATPSMPVTPNPEGKAPEQMMLEKTLQECATVNEAIAFLQEYQLEYVLETAQLFFADNAGDMAILEGDTIWRNEGKNYLVATNFYHTAPELGGHPCWRHDLAEQMLSQELEMNLEFFTSITKAVHQGDSAESTIFTRYTTIANLVDRQLYLYYELDFENYILYDLDEVLAGEGGVFQMEELFEDQPIDDDDDDDTDDDDEMDDDALDDDDESADNVTDDDDTDDDESGCCG